MEQGAGNQQSLCSTKVAVLGDAAFRQTMMIEVNATWLISVLAFYPGSTVLNSCFRLFQQTPHCKAQCCKADWLLEVYFIRERCM